MRVFFIASAPRAVGISTYTLKYNIITFTLAGRNSLKHWADAVEEQRRCHVCDTIIAKKWVSAPDYSIFSTPTQRSGVYHDGSVYSFNGSL